MGSVGFKEWAIVCQALGLGAQSIILRKGGIAEGRGGFSFQHREFFLVPTFFHGAMAKVRDFDPTDLATSDAKIDISLFASIDQRVTITSWEVAKSLEPFHILRSEVVQDRFEYNGTVGLPVALVRVFRLLSPWIVPNDKRFGGCRSWIDLPPPPAVELEPVLSEAEHQRRRQRFLALTRASHEPIRSA